MPPAQDIVHPDPSALYRFAVGLLFRFASVDCATCLGPTARGQFVSRLCREYGAETLGFDEGSGVRLREGVPAPRCLVSRRWVLSTFAHVPVGAGGGLPEGARPRSPAAPRGRERRPPPRARSGRRAIHTPSGRRLPGIALPGAGAGGAARPREPPVATWWRPARRPGLGGRIMRVMRCDTARTKAD